jgi:hypothetical protein
MITGAPVNTRSPDLNTSTPAPVLDCSVGSKGSTEFFESLLYLGPFQRAESALFIQFYEP